MTLGQVATGSGLSTGTISDIEQGRQKGTTKLHKVAEFLRVHVQWLEEGIGPKELSEQPKNQMATLLVHNTLITAEGARVGAEWDKIEGDEYRHLIAQFIEGMVAAQKRSSRLEKQTVSASKTPKQGKRAASKLD